MTSVAVIGTGGTLGASVLEAFENPVTGNFKYPIKAITSQKKVSTDKVQYINLSLDDPELKKELQGIDVVVSLVKQLPDVLFNVRELVKSVRPKIYIPSDFGFVHEEVARALPDFGADTFLAENVSPIDGVKVVVLSTGCFKAPPFLTDLFAHVGIDVADETVSYFGNPQDSKLAVSVPSDIANSIVAISATEPQELLEVYRVQSYETTVQKIAEQYQQSTGTSLKPVFKDGNKERETAQRNLNQGFNPDDLLYYISIIIGSGEGYGAVFSTNERELLNPNESLWKWTKDE